MAAFTGENVKGLDVPGQSHIDALGIAWSMIQMTTIMQVWGAALIPKFQLHKPHTMYAKPGSYIIMLACFGHAKKRQTKS